MESTAGTRTKIIIANILEIAQNPDARCATQLENWSTMRISQIIN
jgi:hypothetical protein